MIEEINLIHSIFNFGVLVKANIFFSALAMVFFIVLVGFLSTSRTIIQVKFSDGSTGEYNSSFYFEKGDNVLIYGPEYTKKIIPDEKEFFQETTIPVRFFPITKDTILIFRYGPSVDISQKVRIGVVVGVFEKNVFQ